jgi:hypothetical protein
MSDDAYLTPEAAAAERALAELLEAGRPLPRATFRQTLARRLRDADPGWGPRPAHLWPQALALIAVGAALLLIGAARSVAAPAAVPSVASPLEPGLALGLSGATNQLTGAAAAVAPWEARAKHVGAQIVRLAVSWSAVAPATRPPGFDAAADSSPAYDWTPVDAAVRQLTAEGFTVFIQLQSAPTWAEGPHMPASATPGSWEPNAAAFGQFATALATRYDGHTPDPLNPSEDLPRVSEWQAWNEPNLTQYLAPQWREVAHRPVAVSPTYYRNLENAFYTAVHAVAESNFVVAGGTAPYGDPPGGQRMSPVTFDQNLLCLNADDHPRGACPAPTEMDAIDDHPYVSGLCCHAPTWHAELPADTSIADMYKIVDLLHAGERAKTVAPAGDKRVWASEIGWDTDPPNPFRNEASPAATVGRWATQALYLLWSQGVDTVLWYQLADDAENPAGWSDTYTEGLYYVGGGAKPAAAALAFPFLTHRTSPTSVEAWGRSPLAGALSIEQRRGGRWVAILTLTVRRDQVFEAPIALAHRAHFRAVIARRTSPVWAQAA